MTTTLRPALAATLSVTFLFTGPVFASEAQNPPAQEETAPADEASPAPEQQPAGRHHRCGFANRGKALRAFFTARDETGTTRFERVAVTGAGVVATTLAAGTLGAVAVATTVAPACVGNLGQCSANIQRNLTNPVTRPVAAPPGAPAASTTTR
ncbi:MAG: hypothetical protein AB2A00_12115 [Myxococcota bacterium]